MAQLRRAQKRLNKVQPATVQVELQQLCIISLRRFFHPLNCNKIRTPWRGEKWRSGQQSVEELTDQRSFFLSPSAVRFQLSYLQLSTLFFSAILQEIQYEMQQKIRHVMSIRSAACLINSGPITTQSLSFSVLIPFFSSVQPAAHLVNSGLNRSQL